jgi:hypothetical protein
MHVHAWLTQIVRISAYLCEQVEVTCAPMHIRGAFKEPGASFIDIFLELVIFLSRSLALGMFHLSLQAGLEPCIDSRTCLQMCPMHPCFEQVFLIVSAQVSVFKAA